MKRQEKLVFLRNFKEEQLIANVIRPLKQALKDPYWHVKDAAFEALYKISRRLGVRIAKD